MPFQYSKHGWLLVATLVCVCHACSAQTLAPEECQIGKYYCEWTPPPTTEQTQVTTVNGTQNLTSTFATSTNFTTDYTTNYTSTTSTPYTTPSDGCNCNCHDSCEHCTAGTAENCTSCYNGTVLCSCKLELCNCNEAGAICVDKCPEGLESYKLSDSSISECNTPEAVDRWIIIALGAVGGIVVIILIILIVFCCVRCLKRRKRKRSPPAVPKQDYKPPSPMAMQRNALLGVNGSQADILGFDNRNNPIWNQNPQVQEPEDEDDNREIYENNSFPPKHSPRPPLTPRGLNLLQHFQEPDDHPVDNNGFVESDGSLGPPPAVPYPPTLSDSDEDPSGPNLPLPMVSPVSHSGSNVDITGRAPMPLPGKNPEPFRLPPIPPQSKPVEDIRKREPMPIPHPAIRPTPPPSKRPKPQITQKPTRDKKSQPMSPQIERHIDDEGNIKEDVVLKPLPQEHQTGYVPMKLKVEEDSDGFYLDPHQQEEEDSNQMYEVADQSQDFDSEYLDPSQSGINPDWGDNYEPLTTATDGHTQEDYVDTEITPSNRIKQKKGLPPPTAPKRENSSSAKPIQKDFGDDYESISRPEDQDYGGEYELTHIPVNQRKQFSKKPISLPPQMDEDRVYHNQPVVDKQKGSNRYRNLPQNQMVDEAPYVKSVGKGGWP